MGELICAVLASGLLGLSVTLYGHKFYGTAAFCVANGIFLALALLCAG